jgi:hypothetical protein
MTARTAARKDSFYRASKLLQTDRLGKPATKNELRGSKYLPGILLKFVRRHTPVVPAETT